MGLPQINFTFSSLAATVISRSARGIAALILREATPVKSYVEYTSLTDVVSADYSATNYQYITDAFLGSPNKVIVLVGDTTDTDYNAQLNVLDNTDFDYLAIPGIASADTLAIATWVKSERDQNNKKYVAVLPNTVGDHEGIINFATDNIVVGSNTRSASDYTARIAGIAAGCPLTRSLTYLALPEVTSVPVQTVAQQNTDIDAGKLILIPKNGKIVIARGVNSLTTLSGNKSAEWKKIKVIAGHDLVKNDIMNTFNDGYVGQVLNDYDQQVIFFTAVNAYLKSLEGTVLDPNGNNSIGIDVNAQRLAIEAKGIDTSNLTVEQIKEMTVDSFVFCAGSMKFLDSMEDITFNITVN